MLASAHVKVLCKGRREVESCRSKLPRSRFLQYLKYANFHVSIRGFLRTRLCRKIILSDHEHEYIFIGIDVVLRNMAVACSMLTAPYSRQINMCISLCTLQS